jgi:hypothetical protein
MALLHQQYNDFTLGVVLIFWGAVLVGLIRLLWTEPRQTARSRSRSRSAR